MNATQANDATPAQEQRERQEVKHTPGPWRVHPHSDGTFGICAANGKGEGIEGARSGLWFEMLRIISELRPAWVVAENVPALRTRGVDIVTAGLEAEGYTVAPPMVVGAWAVGAPHRRDRVWIVAHASRGAGDTGAERAGREAGADVGRGRARTELADPEGHRCLPDTDNLRPGRQGEATRNQSVSGAGHGSNMVNAEGNGCGRAENERPGEAPSSIQANARRADGMGDSERIGGERWRDAGIVAGETGAREADGGERQRLRDAVDSTGADGAPEELVNAAGVRCREPRSLAGEISADEGGQGRGVCESTGAGSLPEHDAQSHRWPARPGEPQHEWEAPRVVADAAQGRLRRGRASRGEGQLAFTDEGADDGEAQPGLGNSANGLPGRMARHRVAKLKSLGNAVVPQVCFPIFKAIVEMEVLDASQI